MDNAEILFLYETAGRLLAAELNGYCNVHAKSAPVDVRNSMVVMATDTALVLWRDVLTRIPKSQPGPIPAPPHPPQQG